MCAPQNRREYKRRKRGVSNDIIRTEKSSQHEDTREDANHKDDSMYGPFEPKVATKLGVQFHRFIIP